MSPLEFNIARLESMSGEIDPIRPGCRAWIVIDPYLKDDPDYPGRPSSLRIRIRIVDIPIQELGRRGWDLDGDEDFIADRLDVVVDDPEAVREVLDAAGIDCDGLGPSFDSRLPF